MMRHFKYDSYNNRRMRAREIAFEISFPFRIIRESSSGFAGGRDYFDVHAVHAASCIRVENGAAFATGRSNGCCMREKERAGAWCEAEAR